MSLDQLSIEWLNCFKTRQDRRHLSPMKLFFADEGSYQPRRQNENVIMAEHLFNDQEQQQVQPNQIQPYRVSFGTRAKARGIPYLPHVPANIGVANFRARQLPAQPVREQQDVMLPQDNVLINQPMIQHNIQQDNIAYNRRQYDQLHFTSLQVTGTSPQTAQMVNTDNRLLFDIVLWLRNLISPLAPTALGLQLSQPVSGQQLHWFCSTCW